MLRCERTLRELRASGSDVAVARCPVCPSLASAARFVDPPPEFTRPGPSQASSFTLPCLIAAGSLESYRPYLEAKYHHALDEHIARDQANLDRYGLMRGYDADELALVDDED